MKNLLPTPTYLKIQRLSSHDRATYCKAMSEYLKAKSSNDIEVAFDKRIIVDSGDLLRIRISKITDYQEHPIFKIKGNTTHFSQLVWRAPYLGNDYKDGIYTEYYSLAVRQQQMIDLVLSIEDTEANSATHVLISREEQQAKFDEFVDNTISVQLDKRYPAWFESQKSNEEELTEQRAKVFSHDIGFSVIIPLYKTPISFLRDVIESFLAQTFSNFELILIRAKDERAALFELTNDYASKDKRIKIVDIEKNIGITETTNFGLEVASKEFVCFADHDDIVEPDLLFEYANAIEEDPELDILSCDEDLLMPDGQFECPTFKPENLDLYMLLSGNYVCHMLTIRRSIVDSLTRPTRRFDGAQDFYMTLRCLAKARKYKNVARPLYHWRVSATSTAGKSDDKTYAVEAGRLAVEEYFKTQDIDVKVENYPNMNFLYLSAYDCGQSPSYEQIDTMLPLDDVLDKVKSSSADYLLCTTNCFPLQTKDIKRLIGYLEQNADILASTAKLVYKDWTIKSLGMVLGEDALHPISTDLPGYHYDYMLKGCRDHSVICPDPAFCVIRKSDILEFLSKEYIYFVEEKCSHDLLVNFMLNKTGNEKVIVCPYIEVWSKDLPYPTYKQNAITLNNRELLPEFDPNTGPLFKKTNGYMQLDC